MSEVEAIMKQITIFECYEKQIPTMEIPKHIGEEVHWYSNPAEWGEPRCAPDQMVTIKTAREDIGGAGVWVDLLMSDNKHLTRLWINQYAESNLWISAR